MRSGLKVLAVAIATGLGGTALAHHGFGTFLMDKDVEITGTVTKFEYVNPHSWLHLDVVNAEGKTVAMRCEMRSATTLRRSGWNPELFPVGKKVTITGNPDRNDPYSCYVGTLIFDDGSRLDRYGQISTKFTSNDAARPVRLANGDPNISGDWAVVQRIMTDPRGQYGTLVPLEEALAIAATGDYTSRGSIGGARGTEQAAAAAAAFDAAAAGDQAPAGAAPAPAQPPAAGAAPGAGRGGGAPGAAPGGGRGTGGPGAAGGPGGGRGGAGPGGGRGGFGGGGNVLNEAGQAALAARPANTDRYAMSCTVTSIATEWGGEPVSRITQQGDTIRIQHGQYGIDRTVHMTMTEHPANITPSLPGHSIGRWEGDTLVVDTVGFAEGLYNARTPHSASMHLVERFSVNPETRQLTRSYTANDPVYWTREQTGSTTMDMSAAPFEAEVCEDLTLDPNADLGVRE